MLTLIALTEVLGWTLLVAYLQSARRPVQFTSDKR
jgi:hypothetical protein